MASRFRERITQPHMMERAGAPAGIYPIRELGSALRHWWEVPDSSSPLITVTAGLVAELVDRVTRTANLTADEAVRPSYAAAGGPGGRPGLTFQSGSRRMTAPVSFPAGNRTGLYIVAAFPASGSAAVAGIMSGGIAGNVRETVTATGSNFRASAAFTGGSVNLDVPVRDASYHVFAIRPLSTGALFQIDGVTTAPNFATSDTLIAMDTMRIGHDSVAAGSFAAAFLTDEPVDEINEVILAYCSQRFSIP